MNAVFCHWSIVECQANITWSWFDILVAHPMCSIIDQQLSNSQPLSASASSRYFANVQRITEEQRNYYTVRRSRDSGDGYLWSDTAEKIQCTIRCNYYREERTFRMRPVGYPKIPGSDLEMIPALICVARALIGFMRWDMSIGIYAGQMFCAW